MNPHYLVLDCPNGPHLRGEILDQANARILEANGGCAIPVDPELVAQLGASGFARSDYGKGVPCSERPERRAAVSIRARATSRVVHWRARFLADKNLAEAFDAPGSSMKIGGRVNITSDPTLSANIAGFSAGGQVELTNLEAPDSRRGWTIGGFAEAVFPNEGHYGIKLHGAATDGLLLQWFAVSVLPR